MCMVLVGSMLEAYLFLLQGDYIQFWTAIFCEDSQGFEELGVTFFLFFPDQS